MAKELAVESRKVSPAAFFVRLYVRAFVRNAFVHVQYVSASTAQDVRCAVCVCACLCMC